MNLQAEKIELVKLILDTEDKSLIGEIKNLFKSREKDFWEDLPEHVKAGIRRGQEELRNGKFIPFEDIQKELDEL
ncbi:MAG: hypothetical protein H7Y13_08625 [Sphingobacteriaceae bacterium]|nr:hypothetical protein [Sphingobacteriaceae bacterium]